MINIKQMISLNIDTQEKLLIALIAALIALFLKVIVDRIIYAHKLNNIRKLILGIFQTTFEYGLNKYKVDCENAIKKIDDISVHVTFDSLPMLTSELIKSFTIYELQILCKDANTFNTLISMNYSIDHLKKTMPNQRLSEMRLKIHEHLEKKHNDKLETKTQITCAIVDNYKSICRENLKLSIETVDGIFKERSLISNHLKQKYWWWFYLLGLSR